MYVKLVNGRSTGEVIPRTALFLISYLHYKFVVYYIGQKVCPLFGS